MLGDNISVNIDNVFVFKWEKTKWFTRARTYAALSYRVSTGNTYIFNGKRKTANTGDVVFVPAGLSYDSESISSEAVVFHFDLVGDVSEDISIFTPSDCEKYHRLFLKAVEIWDKKEPGYKFRATAVFYEIIAQIQADGGLDAGIPDKRIAGAVDCMNRSFSDSTLTIEKLARDACMCDTLFRRKFREVLGVSPKRYLEKIRMEYAVNLLKTGYFSHQQISEKCGYSDVKYFRTAFKEYSGKSISEYLRI